MQTIRLRISNKVYKNLMWLLRKFSNEDVQVIEEDNEYLSVKDYLENEMEAIENGTVDFITLEKLEEELEARIRKHED